MPLSRDGLAVLCRTTPLSDQEWLELIEARRKLIKPHLDTFTLQTLGNVKCLKDDTGTHSISRNNPVVTGQLGLNTQGVFRVAPVSSRVETVQSDLVPTSLNVPDGILYLWGLTRGGEWIVISVSYVEERGWEQRGYEYATKVETEETTILHIYEKNDSKTNSLYFIGFSGHHSYNFFSIFSFE